MEPGTVLKAWNTAVNKREKLLDLMKYTLECKKQTLMVKIIDEVMWDSSKYYDEN